MANLWVKVMAYEGELRSVLLGIWGESVELEYDHSPWASTVEALKDYEID